jgi:ectoine hydroxylase-related dioxygenase (phytanoyl-CoA dioxygenase family)
MTSPSTESTTTTHDQVSHFRREGWIKMPQLLTADELADVRVVCLEEEAEEPNTIAYTGQASGDERLARAYKYQAHPNYRKMWRTSFDLRLRHAVLLPIVRRLSEHAKELIGTDEVRVMADRTFVKPPAQEGSRQSVWHQDLPFLPVDRRGLLTFWIAVEDVPMEVGPLRFVPGSHRLGPLGRIEISEHEYEVEDLLREDDLELVGDPVTVPLLAGDATVHDGLMLHGSPENVSDRPRRAWTVVFMPAATRYTGAPHPNASLNELEMAPNEPFNNEQFLVP